MNSNKLNEILEKHKKWLHDVYGGEYADLSNADLSNADLSNADLSNADLSCADLYNANLSCADLYNANLSCADLRNAITNHVKGQKVISVQVDTSRKNNLINYWVDLDVVTTGCFQGTLKELKNTVKETHKDNEILRKRYERVIKFIEDTVEDYKEND